MERLTKKVDGVWTALCNYGSSPYPIVTQEIIDRLAAYEDTGLAPEEVQIQKEAMESIVKEARQKRASYNIPYAKLADKYGVCKKTMMNAIKGKNWKCVKYFPKAPKEEKE